MNYRILGILLTLLLFMACSDQNNNEFWFLEKDENFIRIKDSFQNYISFFPKEGEAKCTINTWSLNPGREFNIKSVFEYDVELFYQVQSRFKESSIAEYKSNQECLLVLNRFSTHKNYGYPKESEINKNLIDLDCYNDLFPIPNFSNFSAYQTEMTSSKLHEDFIIYVLEAQPGEFLEKNDLTNNKFMPEKWNHGFSKGVALNEEEKLIIYWTIIW